MAATTFVAVLMAAVVMLTAAADGSDVALGCYVDTSAHRQMRFQICEPCADLTRDYCAWQCHTKVRRVFL